MGIKFEVVVVDHVRRLKNEKKVAGAASEIMYNDPRRRYVLCITVEKHRLRFWMFSRSHVTVSWSVDFHKVCPACAASL